MAEHVLDMNAIMPTFANLLLLDHCLGSPESDSVNSIFCQSISQSVDAHAAV